MKLKEILENLCYHDTLNPDHVDDERSNPCYCDNCFYGRTELAEEILKIADYVKKEFHHKVL